ncbi:MULTISPECIES: MgtC/SapB family protein [Chromobacterium]|uniref:Protein MgtC n=1 Tax=Chromobacterium indicum TaxID=3110228 RepID=A0ABV0CNI9_9NEIS|nr:MgtC/SapB family protein [Chromobacterium piscinae]MBX9347289.1 MgtC/SapB family protein [Chromobacterium vaccinii]MCD4505353.1 MgtC/SapB family protein [Chromobacterium piscinae]NHQ80354.1 MgtC/SapB family protein [Chromobacterium vaccinii]
MDLSWQQLADLYWNAGKWQVNLLVVAHLFGGLVLGSLLGYERWYNGRAAGMRTYGLVCMASSAAISIIGYSGYWYGGQSADIMHGDMTRVAQGVLTGIGFLGAGMIMKEGLSISGLTSAASVWMSSVIGILIGVGFYGAAIALTLLCMVFVTVVNRIENILPRRVSLFVSVKLSADHDWTVERLAERLAPSGLKLHEESISIRADQNGASWSFLVSAHDRRSFISVVDLARDIMVADHILELDLQPARN